MTAEGRPILLDGLELGQVIFHSAPAEAIKAATKAAFNISSTKDVQFCPFSDASYTDFSSRGGVAVVYRRQWLPNEWTSDQDVAHPNGAFLKQAWAYTPAIGINELEAVGVLESLHAANKTIARDLQVLKDHDCTVTVKCTTDSQEALRHIGPQKHEKTKALSVELIRRIKHEIQMLHGHGIKVMVELHWCQRNQVPQMCIADQLAGMAKTTRRGFSNAGKEKWSKTIESDMADEIELMLSQPRPLPPTKAPEVKTSDPPTAPPKNPTQKRKERKRRMKKQRLREAARPATASADDPGAHAQLPLPPIPPPTKPGSKAQAEDSNTAGPASLEQPAVGSQEGEEPATAEAMKRKIEDQEVAKEPKKRAKLAHGKEEEENNNAAEDTRSEARQRTSYTCTIPTAGGMDLETRVFGWDIPGGDSGARRDVQCPPARIVVLATMEWRQERRMSFAKMLGIPCVRLSAYQLTQRDAVLFGS